MILGIMGRDGIGKTCVARTVGRYLARDAITLIINTDMILPTTIKPESSLRSLGHYLSIASRQPVTPYLQQDEKIKSLFFAGTSMIDDIYSNQVDLDNARQAEYFIEESINEVGHIVIDLSGQRDDPFLPVTLKMSDMLLFMVSCNAEGIGSIYAMERLFKAASAFNVRIALSKTQGYHDVCAFERTAKRRIDYSFPYSNELLYATACGQVFYGEGKVGKLWDKEVRRVADDLLTSNQGAANG